MVDGQRFDVNFAKGLSNSTVFVPIMSANCLKSFVELGRADKEDFVLTEWIMALELCKRGVVKVRARSHCRICTTAHPLYTRFTNIFGAFMSEPTMRPNPT